MNKMLLVGILIAIVIVIVGITVTSSQNLNDSEMDVSNDNIQGKQYKIDINETLGTSDSP